MDKLTHLDESGRARMVDVSQKPDSERIAIAKGEIIMYPNTLKLIKSGLLKKGDVLAVAQTAGVMAAKKTADLIPLCHPLLLTHIQVDLIPDEDISGIKISAEVKTTGKTGVEMEALAAVTVAALTIYDMAKAVDKTMSINNIRLEEKRGGQSGDIQNE